MSKNILLSLVVVILLAMPVATQSIMVPNDPLRDVKADDLHDLSAGYGQQDNLEAHPPIEGIQDIVVVVGDTGGNYCDKNLQVKKQCRLDLAENLTDEANFADNNVHAFNVIAAMDAMVNDNMSTASPGGYRGHNTVVPDKAIRSDNSTTSSFFWKLCDHALRLKAKGFNVRIVVFAAVLIGDTNQQTSLSFIRQLAQQGIILIAGAGFNGVNLDTATVKFYPAAYAATEPNVIAVAGTDPTGNALEPTSPFGPKTVRWAALGRNLTVPDPTDETYTQTAGFSGTSPSTALVAGIVATTMSYRSRVLAKVVRRVDSSCVAVPGVGFGRPRLDKALEDKPVTLLQGMESVTLVADPTNYNTSLFNPDGRNRIMLLIENVDSPLTAEELTITFTDSNNQALSESIENVVEIPNQEWVTEVVMKIPQGLAPGTVKITLTARGATSSITKNIN